MTLERVYQTTIVKMSALISASVFVGRNCFCVASGPLLHSRINKSLSHVSGHFTRSSTI